MKNSFIEARRMKTDLLTDNVIVHQTNFAHRSKSNSPILCRHKSTASSAENGVVGSVGNNRLFDIIFVLTVLFWKVVVIVVLVFRSFKYARRKM